MGSIVFPGSAGEVKPGTSDTGAAGWNGISGAGSIGNVSPLDWRTISRPLAAYKCAPFCGVDGVCRLEMIHPADALVRASRRWAWAASCATCRFSSAISLRMSSRYSGTRPRLLLLERQNAFLDVAASAGGPDRHADHTPGFGERGDPVFYRPPGVDQHQRHPVAEVAGPERGVRRQADGCLVQPRRARAVGGTPPGVGVEGPHVGDVGVVGGHIQARPAGGDVVLGEDDL